MDIKQEQARLFNTIENDLDKQAQTCLSNLKWLHDKVHPYFFITMADERPALVSLASNLHRLAENRRITLKDSKHELITASMDLPGSLYTNLLDLEGRAISYAEITHSLSQHPATGSELEIMRYEFDRKTAAEVTAPAPPPPQKAMKAPLALLQKIYPKGDRGRLKRAFELLYRNNPRYVSISPPERVARVLWLYEKAVESKGLFMHAEPVLDVVKHAETRVLFAVGNPPEGGYLAQVVGVFNRLGLGVRRAYCLNINNGIHPYLLCTFYVTKRDGTTLDPESEMVRDLKAELYNTQILDRNSRIYRDHVKDGLLTGPEGTLVNAFIAFCHTNLAHTDPDRFDLTEVRRVFDSNPAISKQLTELFRFRFEPGVANREKSYLKKLGEVEAHIEQYNTGHRHLDMIRRAVFKCAVAMVNYTLRTNFYVLEKHSIALRLDPAYLETLGAEFTADLPAERPFRVTFFFGRHAAGYHIGFSDIARGGWRSIITQTPDDFTTNTTTLFREVFVLAHTQHLKNKDIYEGGSKLAIVLDAIGLSGKELVTQRLYKEQFGLINAFLDIFVTGKDGKVLDPRVVDYYGEEEPIELGPDENMHDEMVELIGRLGRQRGYLLGNGIISSKEVGINHKEYGVTSLGVVTFAEIAMKSRGIDMKRDEFTVKITGGPNGDVAGNAMRLLYERSKRVKVVLVVSGTGILYDPNGLDKREMKRIILKGNIDSFRPEKLGEGGMALYSRIKKSEGLRELYKKVVKLDGKTKELWVTTDAFHQEFDNMIFTVDADLFIPAGGRPETVDENNWQKFFGENGEPSCRVITEGANSFFTPKAREELQRRGIMDIRDASANKCGVISSSYEIIANLLMDDKEFLEHKDAYVKDVLAILVKRASSEANLILSRHRGAGEVQPLWTEISRAISDEINSQYAKLFEYFSSRPELVDAKIFKGVYEAHLPRFVSRSVKFRRRIKGLPFKVRCAILASEIATTLVYEGGWESDFDALLNQYVKEHF